MMEAKELRVGNLLQSGNRIVVVENIMPYGINYMAQEEDVDYSFDILEPVSLTEEILLKCGFTKYEHDAGYDLEGDITDKCDEYGLSKLSIMDWGDGFVLSNSFSFNLRVELKSLHQLQNLYFPLTGEELEVNL